MYLGVMYLGLDILIPILIEVLPIIFEWAIKEGVKLIVRKIVDSFGRVSTEIYYLYDSDGDGELDSEEVIYTLDTMIPNLSDGYCLVNKGDEIGLGMPQYKILDGFEISELIDTDIITGNDNGFIVDLDNDGEMDDILIPLPDFTGDGYNDWGWLVDDDDNGLPDVSPFSPFYPVGSEGYTEIISRVSEEDYTIMNKPIAEYTVTEGILLIFFIAGSFTFFKRMFRRRNSLKGVTR